MMHWTSPCREPLTPASPPPRHGTSLHKALLVSMDLEPVQGPPIVLTSGGQEWRPVQTCSLEIPLPPTVLKHIRLANVEDVEDIKTSHNRFLTDFLVFISLLFKMCTNYNVDSNMKSSNYSKIRFKPLNYFEFELKL